MKVFEARHEIQVKTTCMLAEFGAIPISEFIEKQGELMTIAGRQQASYSRLRSTGGIVQVNEFESRLMGMIILEKNKTIEALRKQVELKKANIAVLKERLNNF
jgi:hypothetical protein